MPPGCAEYQNYADRRAQRCATPHVLYSEALAVTRLAAEASYTPNWRPGGYYADQSNDR
jgi:hypothetical protein